MNIPKRIILTGPESTGKTTLAKHLAYHLTTAVVHEYARDYISSLNRPYTTADILNIAKGQIEWERQGMQLANKYVICDTSMLVLKVWSEYKFGICPPFILDELKYQKIDLFVLCGIDVPWEFDQLRENPNERQKLYEIYKKELTEGGFHFIEVSGSVEDRINQIKGELQIWNKDYIQNS